MHLTVLIWTDNNILGKNVHTQQMHLIGAAGEETVTWRKRHVGPISVVGPVLTLEWYSIAILTLSFCLLKVFPIENSMQNPRHFLGCPGVLNVTTVWLTVLYCVMGFFGYLRYGEEVHGAITLNLPPSV